MAYVKIFLKEQGLLVGPLAITLILLVCAISLAGDLVCRVVGQNDSPCSSRAGPFILIAAYSGGFLAVGITTGLLWYKWASNCSRRRSEHASSKTQSQEEKEDNQGKLQCQNCGKQSQPQDPSAIAPPEAQEIVCHTA